MPEYAIVGRFEWLKLRSPSWYTGIYIAPLAHRDLHVEETHLHRLRLLVGPEDLQEVIQSPRFKFTSTKEKNKERTLIEWAPA
jgi:hypothetical protein